MAYIKHRAIHVTPRAHLKYILNPGKNEEMKYSTAICCTNDYEAVCEDFRQLYEMFSDDKFDNYKGKKNNHVRIHSYIQSFDDSVSPETAHQISVEWAKAMFGENRPVIVSTHTNTGHCHNHIAVCPFDVYGNRWLANKKTYQLAREVSDRICLEHGLSIIENPKKNKSLTYAEWLAKRNGSSWKTKMADVIDRLIVSDDVTDIDSLILKMKERGYIFTNEKRFIAKPQKVKYGCSVAKLGYGYSMEMLKFRIENKQNEFTGRNISAYLGVQVELAVTIRENQLDVYRSQGNERISYFQVKRTAELFCYVHENHIYSVNDMKAIVKNLEKKDDKILNRYLYLEKEKKLLDLLNKYGDEYACLQVTPNKNEQQRKRFEELYNILLNGGMLCYDTYSDNWLAKLKNKFKSDLSEMDSVTAELRKANAEYYQAQVNLSELEKVLETDFDRIRKQEHLRRQIEMYHQGFEPQEDGSFRQESKPTIQRNAELEYLQEKQRQIEVQRRKSELEQERIAEEQARERRRKNSYYSR